MEEKKLLKEYSQLHKQLKKYSYIRHIYELSDSETSAMIIGIILIAPFIAIGALFIAIGGFFRNSSNNLGDMSRVRTGDGKGKVARLRCFWT